MLVDEVVRQLPPQRSRLPVCSVGDGSPVPVAVASCLHRSPLWHSPCPCLPLRGRGTVGTTVDEVNKPVPILPLWHHLPCLPFWNTPPLRNYPLPTNHNPLCQKTAKYHISNNARQGVKGNEKKVKKVLTKLGGCGIIYKRSRERGSQSLNDLEHERSECEPKLQKGAETRTFRRDSQGEYLVN